MSFLRVDTAAVLDPPTFTPGSMGSNGARLAEAYGGPGSGSWLTTKLPDNAAIMADGGAARDAIVSDLGRNTPWINRSSYCPQILVVPADQPYKFVFGDGSRFNNDVELRKMLNGGVPIPDGVQPAAGTDSEMTVYMPDWRWSGNPESSGNPPDGCIWEIWKARSPEMNNARTDGALNNWSGSWAGRMAFANKRLTGHFRDVTFNGQAGFSSPGLPESHNSPYEKRLWGTQATSIPFIGTTITQRDMALGTIDHPLQFMMAGVPVAQQVPWCWPAQRRDGGSQVGLPQGARLRFPAGMPTPAGLNPMARMIFEAARDYGIVFTDTATGFILRGEPGMEAHYKAKQGVATFPDPAATMRSIPWNQLVRLEVGTDSNVTPTV